MAAWRSAGSDGGVSNKTSTSTSGVSVGTIGKGNVYSTFSILLSNGESGFSCRRFEVQFISG